MNLEKMNLVELNAQEVEATTGGDLKEVAGIAFVCLCPWGVAASAFALGVYNGYNSQHP